MSRTERSSPDLNRAQMIALIVGLVGLAICAVGAFFEPTQFFQSYLFAYLFWLGLGLGCLAFMMLQYLAGGGWGLVIRRLLESGSLTLPLMALLFIPLVFGMDRLYIWTHEDVVAVDELIQQKRPYLTVWFFLVRALIYFVTWIALVLVFNRWSREQDRTGDPALPRRFRLLSAGGLMLYVLTMTFAAFDWGMSIEPHWFSTIYGVIFIIGQGLTALAFVIIVATLLADEPPLSQVITTRHFHDLGNFLLAFVMLWTYMNFSQFLIIWSANIPEEVTWYLHRTEHGWEWVAIFLLLFHFFLPFFLLLMRGMKRNTSRLSKLAGALMVVQLIGVFWLIVPSFHVERLHIHWLDIAAPIGIGGVWIAAFIWNLKSQPIVPLHDPRLHEVAAQAHAHA